MSLEWLILADDGGASPSSFIAQVVTPHRSGHILLFGDDPNSEAQAGVAISEIKAHRRFTIMVNEKKALQNQGTTTPVNIHWLLQKFQEHNSFRITVALLRKQAKTVTTVASISFESVVVTHWRSVPYGYTFEFKATGKIEDTYMKE